VITSFSRCSKAKSQRLSVLDFYFRDSSLKTYKTTFIHTGTIGDFEIGAKWHWKINLHTISVCLLAVAVALLLFLAAGFIQLGMQFAELSKARIEIQEARSEVLKIQSEMQDELRRLREESELNISYGNETDVSGDSRAKRSIAKPNSGRKSKDLKSPKHKKQNATADKSSSVSKQQHSYHSHGIFWCPFLLFWALFFPL